MPTGLNWVTRAGGVVRRAARQARPFSTSTTSVAHPPWRGDTRMLHARDAAPDDDGASCVNCRPHEANITSGIGSTRGSRRRAGSRSGATGCRRGRAARRRAHQYELQGHDGWGRRLRRSHLGQGHRPARDRPSERGAQHDLGLRVGRRCRVRRVAARARRARPRVHPRRRTERGTTCAAATGF